MFFDWSFAASEDTLKTHKAKQRGYRSARLSHKAMCRGLSCDSHSKTLTSTPRMNMVIYAFGNCGIYAFECFWVTLLMGKGTTWLWTQKVDLSKLDMPALQRYIRHFNLVSSRGTFSWLPVKLWKWVFVFFFWQDVVCLYVRLIHLLIQQRSNYSTLFRDTSCLR